MQGCQCLSPNLVLSPASSASSALSFDISQGFSCTINENSYFEEGCHRFVSTANLELIEESTVSIASFGRTLGYTTKPGVSVCLLKCIPSSPKALTSHAICILPFILSAHHICNLFPLHFRSLEIRAIQDILVRACPALKSVDAKWILGGRRRPRYRQRIAAIWTDCVP